MPRLWFVGRDCYAWQDLACWNTALDSAFDMYSKWLTVMNQTARTHLGP
jgi:hypothetical protein